MNRIYRLVWNSTLAAWQTAPETARGRGKGQGGTRSGRGWRRARRGALAAALAVGLSAGQSLVQADPITGIDGGDGGTGGDISFSGAGSDVVNSGGFGGLGQAVFGQSGGGAANSGGVGGDPVIDAPFVLGGDGGGGGGLENGGIGGGGGGGASGTQAGDDKGGGGGGGGGLGFALAPGNLPSDASVLAGGVISLASNITGGTGGAGAGFVANSQTGSGGGGGGGGAGIFMTGMPMSVSIPTTVTVRGGSGGPGGNSYGDYQAGNGGGGGAGIVVSAASTLLNSGQVVGGAGAATGNGLLGIQGFPTRTPAGDSGGTGGGDGGGSRFGMAIYTLPAGGGGGAAVVLTQGAMLVNKGSVTGGNAGSGNGSPGGAGVIALGGSTVDNTGTITAGANVGNAIAANAIDFRGGGNTLIVEWPGSITGKVVSQDGGDTLVLGGNAPVGGEAVFDVSKIGALGGAQQYQGFANYQKTGASDWTLAGTTSAVTPWRIVEGTLIVSNEDSLGAPSSQLVLAGGTLQSTASLLSTSRQISLAGGTSEIDAPSDITIAAGITGSGDLTIGGAGTLTLTGANTYTGTTQIQGTLVVQGPTASLPANSNIANNGTLTFDSAGTLTLNGRISGAGQVRQIGSGALTLSNFNSYFGGTYISGGTLNAADGGSLGSGLTTVANGTLAVGGGMLNQLTFQAGTSNTLEVINGGDVEQVGSLTVGGNLKLTSDGASATLSLSPSSATGVDVSAIEIGPNLALTTGANFDVAIAEGATSVQLDAGAVWQSSSTSLVLSNLQGQGDLTANLLSVASGDFAGKLTTTSLTKTGTGTLTLSGSDDQENGTVRVNAGKLVVDTALAPSATVTVASGATLAGKGSMGSTTIQDNAFLAPGDSGGVLTIHGGLTLSSQSQLVYTLGSPGTPSDPAAGTSSRIVVDGDLRLAGVLSLSPSTVPTDGTAAVGYYRLMTYGGTLDDEGVAVQASGLPASITGFAVLASGGHVDLAIGADGVNTAWQQWAGGSGAWDSSSPSWTNADGNVPVTWGGTIAVFKDGAGVTGGTIAVQGTQTFQGLQFVDEGYALTGPGTLLIDGSANTDGNAEIRVLADSARIDTTITGLGGITKTEAGTLILGGNNNYMGGTVVDEGTVQVSRDANLGSPIGALTLNGGTLQTTAVFATPRSVVLDGLGGTFQTDADLMLSGIVVGQGALTKTGSGVLTLTSGNAYQGGTIIKSGTVAAFADINLGAPTGPLVFDGGAFRWNSTFDLSSSRAISLNAGGGTLDTNGHDTTIAQAMTGVGGLVKTGEGTLTLLGENTYVGGTSIDGGTIQVGNGGTSGSLIGNATDNGALVFARADDLTFGGAISGTGSLRQAGGGNLTLTADSSAFAGTTDVATGTLTVNGKLGGTLAVADGATLSGTGSVGSTVLASGATLAPGNATAPAGSLSVNGDLSFGSGSTYRVTAGPGLASNTFVHVSGTATLAGSVVHVGPEGNYAASSTFRILSADRGLRGSFDSVSSNFAFLNPTLAYTANDVDLRIDMKQVADNPPPDNGTGPGGDQGSRPIRFADAAVTGNQRAVANALQSLPTTNGLYTRVLNLPNGAPPAVFDSLSGEAYASTVSTLQGVTDNVAALSTEHLRANLDAGLIAGPPTAQLGAGDGSALPRSAAQPVWAQVFGNWRTMAGNGDASKVEQSDGGLFIGGDHGMGKGWRLGGALGYTGTHSTVDGRSSTADVDSYSATIYGGKAFAAGIGKINFMLGAGYTWHDIKAKRSVDAAGQSQDLDANYSASTGQFFTELGYALPLNDRATLEPFVGADYSDLHTRGFSESGGDAALQGQGNRNQVAATTLGLHGQYSFESGDSQGRLRGTVGWRHAYGDVDPTTTMAFSGSQPFTVAGTPIARDSAVLELGVDMAVTKHTTVGVAYGGQFGAGNRQNTGSIDVRWRF